MRTVLTLTLFIASSGFLFGYENFQKGYVVFHRGDTIRGWIDNQMWENSPTQISFRESADQMLTTVYTTEHLSFFFLEEGADLFIGMDLKFRVMQSVKSTAPDNSEAVPFIGFVKVLVSGSMSLYKLSLNGSEYFFSQMASEHPIQLEKRVMVQKKDGRSYSSVAHIYRGYLQSITQDFPELSKRAAKIEYGEKSFSMFATDYNRKLNALGYVDESEGKRFYGCAGVVGSVMPTSLQIVDNGNSPYEFDWLDAHAVSPAIGGFFILYSSKGQGKVGLYNELVYKTLMTDLSYQYNQGVFSYEGDAEVRMKRLRYALGIRLSTTKSKTSTWFGQMGFYRSMSVNGYDVKRYWVRDSNMFPEDGSAMAKLDYAGWFIGFGYRLKMIELEASLETNRGGSETPLKAYGLVVRWRVTKR